MKSRFLTAIWLITALTLGTMYQVQGFAFPSPFGEEICYKARNDISAMCMKPWDYSPRYYIDDTGKKIDVR